ncbi:hypothetical protein BGX28_007565 [Mortierella sp. GBA30]|nr:hypothetical protein BGX28_007565 [Mortierella sp. GBA30]
MSSTKKVPPASKGKPSVMNNATKLTKPSPTAPNTFVPGPAAPAPAPNSAKSSRPSASLYSSSTTKSPKTPLTSKSSVIKSTDPAIDASVIRSSARKDATVIDEAPKSEATPEYVAHKFEWSQGGANVKVTGSFDNWQQSVEMKRAFNHQFEAIVDLDRSKKILFKFVVDGQWRCTDELATEFDENGNQNNILPAIEA